jgi:hypothetical protein
MAGGSSVPTKYAIREKRDWSIPCCIHAAWSCREKNENPGQLRKTAAARRSKEISYHEVP